MFSVTKTELNVFPLCTKNVWPTKSGVTIERRDQVLIGFLAPELFILSIFSRRYDSTKGPFFNDLAIKIKFYLVIWKPGSQEARNNFEVLSQFLGFLVSRLDFFLRPSSLQNETIARFMFTACFKSFRQLPPWTDWMMASAAAF